MTGVVSVDRTDSDHWRQKLDAGVYLLRTRSVDDRGVAGAWSESVEIPVRLDDPIINSTSWAETVQCDHPFQCEFEISWSPSRLSDRYEVQVFEGGHLLKTQTTKESNLKLNLTSNRVYQFAVLAASNEHPQLNARSPLSKEIQFVGKALKTPQIQRPVDDLITEVHWDSSDGATNYEYEVATWRSGAWSTIVTERTAASVSPFAPLDRNWPGGRYKIRVRATAELATSSDWSELVFFLRHTDRSPPQVEALRSKQVIEYPSIYYLNAGYDLTRLQYSSDINENQSHASFSSIGSALAIGAGFVPSEHWSADTNVGLGFLKVSGQSFNPLSLGLAINFRHDLTSRSQLSYGLGFFYNELPVVQGLATSYAVLDKISVAGPRLLARATQTISRHWAADFALSADYDALKVGGPGGAISPSLSNQIELSLHYWINYRLRTVFGIKQKSQAVIYQPSSVGSSSSSSSMNRIAEDNSIFSLQFNWSFEPL